MSTTSDNQGIAYYHRRGSRPKAYAVAARHEDGTVDLADASNEVVVRRCPVVAKLDARADGVATLGEIPASEADTQPVEPVAAPDKPRRGRRSKAAEPEPEPEPQPEPTEPTEQI